MIVNRRRNKGLNWMVIIYDISKYVSVCLGVYVNSLYNLGKICLL